MEVLIGVKERLGTRGASKPTRENDDGKRRTIICWSCGKKGHACRTILQSGPILRTASGKLPSLSGTSLPHGESRPVTARDDKLTVPSLAVNSGVSYRIRDVRVPNIKL